MLIGLTGYAGAGKDTSAKILAERYGFRRYSFADKLRSFVYELNPLIIARGPDDILVQLRDAVDEYGWDFVKREYPLARHYLQKAGVWFREHVDEDYWVRIVDDNMRSDGYPDAVITDVRFPNEVAYVLARGGYVVRVNRDGVGPANGHVSERADALYRDFDVDNSGSLDDLAAELDRVIANIKERDAIR
jgi:hypothetical protein